MGDGACTVDASLTVRVTIDDMSRGRWPRNGNPTC